MVTDLKMVKEMFSQEVFSGRLNPGRGVNDLYTNGQMHGELELEYFGDNAFVEKSRQNKMSFGRIDIEAFLARWV